MLKSNKERQHTSETQQGFQLFLSRETLRLRRCSKEKFLCLDEI